jgi:hypothetical protein
MCACIASLHLVRVVRECAGACACPPQVKLYWVGQDVPFTTVAVGAASGGGGNWLAAIDRAFGSFKDARRLACCVDAASPFANRGESCATWASRGDCASNPSYMQYMCRRTCGTCGVLKPRKLHHPLLAGYEFRLLDEAGQELRDRAALRDHVWVLMDDEHWVWPSVRAGFSIDLLIGWQAVRMRTLALRPRLFHLSNFLSAAECDHVIATAETQMTRSGVVEPLIPGQGSGAPANPNVRTSNYAFLAARDDAVVQVGKCCA